MNWRKYIWSLYGDQVGRAYDSGVEEAITQEKQRIIKLLKKVTYYGASGTLEFTEAIYSREELIELIKGETNE